MEIVNSGPLMLRIHLRAFHYYFITSDHKCQILSYVIYMNQIDILATFENRKPEETRDSPR